MTYIYALYVPGVRIEEHFPGVRNTEHATSRRLPPRRSSREDVLGVRTRPLQRTSSGWWWSSYTTGWRAPALEERRLGGRRLMWPALRREQPEYVLRCELLEHVIGYGIHVGTC